uniref:Dynein light chain n=1 Tax=Panagrolaimus davidi TaxID=227884 RepID=A0A914PVP0_9BILA
MPKLYKLSEVRDGANAMSNGAKTQMSGEKFESAVRIIFEAIKIHSYPEEREWLEMCSRIRNEMKKLYPGSWHCIAYETKFYSIVESTSGDYMTVKLDDLYIELFRSH